MTATKDVYKKNISSINKEFNFKDFANLDESADVDYLIDSMDELFEIEGIRAMKKRAIQELSVKQGATVLELGCGLGFDAEAFSYLVGEEGHVIAVDASQRMLTRAKSRFQCKNIDYQFGNANKLEFPACTFDICHADRLLVSQTNPIQTIKESIRVLKYGGKLAITDCDFGSIVFHPCLKDTTNLLITRMQEITQNPFIGRELPTLLKNEDLIDISVFPEPYIVRSFNKINSMINIPRILSDLCQMKRLTEEAMQEQLYSFQDADKQGDFLYCITFFTVIGKKPI